MWEGGEILKKNLILITASILLIGSIYWFFIGVKFQEKQTIQLPQETSVNKSITTEQKPKSTDAREIVVDGSNFKFSPDKINVKKDEKVRILFKNIEGVHDFKVDELNIATAIIKLNQEDWVEFTASKTGSFEFYCSVGSHRTMGMKGTLIVE